jgi:hypothetical protein
LRHRPTDLTAKSEDFRYLEENRRRAAQRLRLKIALETRAPFDLSCPDLPPEFVAQRGADGKMAVNPANPAYPLIVATALDAFAAAGGSYAAAARALGLTTSQLLRLLQSDRQIRRAVSEAASDRVRFTPSSFAPPLHQGDRRRYQDHVVPSIHRGQLLDLAKGLTFSSEPR